MTLVLQNAEVVELRLLFWSVRMSRIVMLSVAMAIGFVAGMVVASLSRRRGSRLSTYRTLGRS